jgi:N-acetylneuraminate synthase
MRKMAALYRNTDGGGEDLSVQYTLSLLNRFELSTEQMIELFDYAKSKDIIPMCTPWDLESLEILDRYGIAALKVASADLTNHPLLAAMALTHRPLILSTGMSTETEISESVNLLKSHGAMYALLHCNSTYPAPFSDINLSFMDKLTLIGDCPVGYSGHERGINIAIAAVARGARIIEKHLTFDRNMEGSDHGASLLPHEFFEMVTAIREVESALGDGKERIVSQGEMMNRSNLAKSIISTKKIKAGEVITRDTIDIRSPGRGLQPNRLEELVGRRARRDILPGDFFYPSDIDDIGAKARNYSFSRPWGLTVRWHDMEDLLKKSNPDFFEFHLSYKDMDEDYLSYFTKPLNLDLKVHSPDTFSGDHLLDLSNPDPVHRHRSINELQRVIDLTRDLKPYFKKAENPAIIASLGGFSMDGFLAEGEVQLRYELLADSIGQLDMSGVQILGQTLPPFPWYFGGQRYLNLFVRPLDTINFCEKNNLKLCFDTSHSKLACNYFGYSYEDYIQMIAPYVEHVHFGDASGTSGEGLQIGHGDINFQSLSRLLNSLSPRASFIPEIWQGHVNSGEGFWIALERLEAFLNV